LLVHRIPAGYSEFRASLRLFPRRRI